MASVLSVSSLLWAGGRGTSKQSLVSMVRISLIHRKHLSIRGDRDCWSTKIHAKYHCCAPRFQRRAEWEVKGFLLREKTLELAGGVEISLLTVWSMDQQHQRHWGAWEKCGTFGPIWEPLNQNLPFNKIPGDSYLYHSLGSTVLALQLNCATMKTLRQADLWEKKAKPLGCSSCVWVLPKSLPLAALLDFNGLTWSSPRQDWPNEQGKCCVIANPVEIRSWALTEM